MSDLRVLVPIENAEIGVVIMNASYASHEETLRVMLLCVRYSLSIGRANQ